MISIINKIEKMLNSKINYIIIRLMLRQIFILNANLSSKQLINFVENWTSDRLFGFESKIFPNVEMSILVPTLLPCKPFTSLGLEGRIRSVGESL